MDFFAAAEPPPTSLTCNCIYFSLFAASKSGAVAQQSSTRGIIISAVKQTELSLHEKIKRRLNCLKALYRGTKKVYPV
jgi:hypothetical protein